MGLLDELEKKKKTSSNTPKKGLLQELEERRRYQYINTDEVDKDYQTYIDSFFKDATDFFSTSEKDVGGVNWSTASSMFDSKSTASQDLRTRADTISAWLLKNRADLDEESYSNLYNALDEYRGGISSVVNGFKSNRDFYAQFDTEDMYNAWKAKEDEKQAVLNSEDFGHYSQIGANIKNPENIDNPKSGIYSGEEIGNPVTLSREYASFIAMMEANGGNTAEYGLKYKYSFMEDDEVNLYNYYLAKYGKEKASEYLASLEDTLEQRHAGAMIHNADNTAMELLFSAMAGIEQAKTGFQNLDNLFKGTEGDNRTSAITYAQAGMSANNDGLWKVANDLVNTTGNMLPSILLSSVMPVGGALAGAASMGLSATGNAYSEMRSRGYSANQARAYGIMVGASEAALSYALSGISKLGGKGIQKIGGDFIAKYGTKFTTAIAGIDNAIARVAIQYGGQMIGKMGSEAFEEGLQSILEPMFNSIVTGEDLDIDWGEVAYSALLGGLSAGMLEGGTTLAGTIYNDVSTTKYGQSLIDKKSVPELQALALEMAGVSKETDILSQKANTKPTAHNVGEFALSLGNTVASQNLSDVTNALVEKGLSQREASKVAQKLLDSKKLSNKQMSKEAIKAVADELVNNPSSSINERKASLTAAREGLSYKALKESAQNTGMSKSVQTEVDVKDRVSEDGKTTQVSTGEAITIDNSNPIAKTKDGKVYFNTDKGVVESSDISYASESDGLIYESFVDLNPAFANALIRNYDGKMPVQKYIKGMREGVILYGRHNFQGVGKDISAATYFAELSKADQAFALKLGRNYATHEAKIKDAPIRNALKNAVEKAKAAESTTNSNGAKKTTKKGTVSFEEGARIESVKEDKAERRAEIKAKSKAVSLAKNLAKALGVDIVFYDSRTKKKGEDGYKDNGYYDSDTGTIHLDLQNAKDDTKTIAYTLSHELVHWLKAKSATDFNNFAKFLMEQYAEHGVDTSAMLKNKMNEYDTDADEAFEEMICQACETLLLDSNAVVKLMELRKTDLGLFERIKLHIAELLNTLRNMYKQYNDTLSDEAKALLSMTDVIEQIHSKFEDAMVGAAKNAQIEQSLEAVQNSNKTVFGEASIDVKAVESGVKNQLKAYKKTGEASITYNDKHKNVQKAILQTGIEAMYEMAETMLPYLEEEGILPPDIPGKTIFKNGSYGKTGENTTLCVRTLTYEDFKDRVAEKVGRPLTVAESLLVSQKIYDIATEPQCIYCYVAADRKAYDEYLGEYHKAMDKYIKALRNGGDSKALYTEYLAGRKDTDAQKKRWSQWEAIAKSGKDYISANDLTTKRKRDRIIANKNAFSEQIKDAQRYAQSASWAKTVCDYRAYKGDILKMTSKFVDMLNSEYGLRMYSFSDYTPAFIVENMQMLIDASVKGLKSLAYTKDTDYVEIFASTGQAINVSCFARWDAESGTFVEDNRQGANWEKTKNLRKQYRNVGAVMVATNDAMVEWALKQDWIDVVIPYHIVKTGTTIANEYQWNNYTSESSDKSGNRAANIYPTEHNNDFATYSNLLNERGITPRFSRWYDMVASGEITEAQYMKLVNEVRLPASELSPVIPKFNLEAAKRSFGVDNEGNVIEGGFVDKGGYMGGWYRQGVDVNQEVMAVSEDINAGKSSLEVDYGMSKSAKEKVERRYVKKQVKRIVGESGTDYGIGVYLDSTLLSDLTEDERVGMVKEYIKELGGSAFTAYDNNQNAVDVHIVESNRKFKNKSGKTIPVNKDLTTKFIKNKVKQEAIALVDEMILTSSYDSPKPALYPHGWLDNYGENDWEYWVTYVQDKENTIWEATLNIATTTNGEKILYDINPIKKVEQSVKSDTSTTDKSISQKKPIVKRQQKKTSSYAPTFYSQMGKEIDAIKMDKVGSASLINYLKGKGIKHDEIKWSGIEAFLEGKKSVTKAELQEFLAGSQLQIEETTLTNEEKPYASYQLQRISGYESEREDVVSELKTEWKRVFGNDIPIQHFGAGLESDVVSKIIEAEREIKNGQEVGKKLTSAREALKKIFDNDDFGYESSKKAYMAAVRDAEVFMDENDLSPEEIEILENFIRAKTDFQTAQGIPLSDKRALIAIAKKSDDISRMISNVHMEHYSESAKHMPRWGRYKLDGGTNYRELLFSLPDSSYTNDAMYVHWEEREGILAHARAQDFDINGKKMLFIEEIQSDWHNEGAKDGYQDAETESKIKRLREEADIAFYELEDYSTELTGTAGEYQAVAKTQKGRELLRNHYKTRDALKDAENAYVKKVPDAPFRDTYHEYVLKRLLRMAAEEGYDSIGWTPAEIQDKRWADGQYHEEGKGKSGFLKGYTVEYDQDIPSFLKKYGKKWGATVGKTTVNGDTQVWSMDVTEPMVQSVLYEGQAKFQKKKVSNRTLLANALETTIDASTQEGQNELKKLAEYKSKIDMLEKEEAHLAEVKAEIYKISFTKGSDRSQLTALNDDKIKTQNRIHVLDSQLLRYEAMKPIQDVLAREKDMLREKVEEQAKKNFDAYRESIQRVQDDQIGREREVRKEAIRREKRRSQEAEVAHRWEIAELREQMSNLRKEMANAVGEERQKKREAIDKLRAQMNDRLAKMRESQEAANERRKSGDIRSKIKNLKTKMESSMLHPTDRGYVPLSLIGAMVDVCELIDTDTDLYKKDGSLNQAQVRRNLTKEKLQALKDEYENLKTNADPMYSGEYDEVIYKYLTKLLTEFKGKSLSDMSLSELTEMYDVLKSINETLQDARKLIGRAEAKDIYESADAIAAGQAKIKAGRKKGKRNTAQRARDWGINLSLSPVRNVERMCDYNENSPLLEMFRYFEKGVRKKNKFVMESHKDFEALTTGKNSKNYDDACYNAFGDTKYTDVNGRTFGISKMQMMQTILSYEREVANNMNHIAVDGFSFADLDMLRKGNLKEAISSEYSHRISDSAIEMVQRFKAELKDDQWAQDYMAASRKFFDGKAKDAVNETYITLKHRIIARDKNYIPFEVDKNFVVREITAQNDVQQTINSYGMLQETKKGASQPLIITGLNNILERHIDQVGNVYGLAVEIRNFNKLWNTRPVDSGFEGDPLVKGIVEANWGIGGRKHIEQAVQDIQGARPNTQSALYQKVKSNYIGATFLLNWSVVSKQIGSLFTATSMLRWRDPARMIGNLVYTMVNHKNISAEVDKYTATAWMRRQGLSDGELYTLATQAKQTKIGKTLDKLPAAINPRKWITAMDSMVALSLWKYAKQDTAKRTGLTGEDLLKATAEFYDSVIENTQSMSDVLHRPEIQKRSDVLSEAFGMFKTDLYQSAGQLQVTLGRFTHNRSKENGKVLARTLYSTLMSSVWGSLMTTAFALLRYKVNQYRDDEDDELTMESWLTRQGMGVAGDIVGYIFPIVGSEFVGIIENIMYGESDDIVDSIALTAINDLYNTMLTVGAALKDGEMPTSEQYLSFVTKALQAFGVPASNILRTVNAIKLHAKDIANGEFFSFEAGLDKPNAQRLYNAILSGDEDRIEKAKRNFEDEDDINAAFRKALRDEYKDGNISRSEAMDMLIAHGGMKANDAYWKMKEYDYYVKNGTTEGYSKYNEFYEAVKTGNNLKAVIQEHLDHGTKKSTLASQITEHYKPLYREMSNSERASLKGYLLNAYALLGYNRAEKNKDINDWLKD